ncbi:MAG TPA: aromatic ring-hydroxylating dioxygenase subunit alpha [Burkholderiales bacterium]
MQLQDLLIDDPQRGVFRVHRSTMTSDEVLAFERERIFERCWLYVGHESEVAQRGSYRRRQVAGRPLFIIRGSDGAVRVLENSCRHRGAMVCRADAGSAEAFTCFYHGWTYNNKGELVGVPDAEGYPPSFDRGQLGLHAPRTQSYRGFYFVNFAPQAEDLISYLGDARAFIDMVADQSAAGIRVVPNSIRYGINANWKLMAENSVDSYHVPSLHQTYLQYMARQGVTVALQEKGKSWGLDLGKGHGAFSGLQRSEGAYGSAATRLDDATRQHIERIRQIQLERYGKELADRDWAPGRVNFLVYPNLAFVGKTTVRTIWPVGASATEVIAWTIVPADESGAGLDARVNDVPLFQGPGGFATPDDVEALESCQAGFAAREVEWTDLSKGMQRAPQSSDEVQIRAFWRQWHADVLGLPAPRIAHDRVAFAAR